MSDTPIAYSGVQIKISSDTLIKFLKSTTSLGGFSVSRSGLKCGISESP